MQMFKNLLRSLRISQSQMTLLLKEMGKSSKEKEISTISTTTKMMMMKKMNIIRISMEASMKTLVTQKRKTSKIKKPQNKRKKRGFFRTLSVSRKKACYFPIDSRKHPLTTTSKTAR